MVSAQVQRKARDFPHPSDGLLTPGHPTNQVTKPHTAQPNLESGWNLSFDFEYVVKSYENMPDLL